MLHLNDKSPCLSRQALISQHGRLLQDCGFTKRDSAPTSSLDWGRTTMNQLVELSSRSEIPMGMSPTGRLATQSSRRAALSTSRQTSHEILSMLRSAIAALSSFAKTSCPLGRSGCPGRVRGTASWELSPANTRCHGCSLMLITSLVGSIPTPQGHEPLRRFGSPLPLLDFSALELRVMKTLSGMTSPPSGA